jgi:glycosyltransferase involved in cell wall biosynthesis
VENSANNHALVSVVMVVWQGDRRDYVDAAIRSILKQTHGALELIVVKNGPLNEAVEYLIHSLIASDTRVRLLDIPCNAGPAEARNRAIHDAKGEYIAILDADDIAELNRIEKQLAFIEAQRADLVGSCYHLMDERGNIVAQKRMPMSESAIRKSAHYLNPISNSTVLAKADVLRKHPYPKSEVNGITFGEDYALWIDMLLQGLRLSNEPDYLVRFRTGSDFLKKRSGWIVFRTDLRNKIKAVALLQRPQRPIGYVVAVLSTLSRLMPKPVLSMLYSIRNRLTFDMH